MTTDIVYNGTIIAALDAEQSAIIKCRDTRMITDVEILFTGDGNIQYDGVETTVRAGQKVTLSCANKRMRDDLVVNLVNLVYRKLIPPNRDSFITADNQTLLIKEN